MCCLAMASQVGGFASPSLCAITLAERRNTWAISLAECHSIRTLGLGLLSSKLQLYVAIMPFQADRQTFVPGQNQHNSLPPLAGTSAVWPAVQERWMKDAPVNKRRKTTSITQPTDHIPQPVPITVQDVAALLGVVASPSLCAISLAERRNTWAISLATIAFGPWAWLSATAQRLNGCGK
jgi:hypothetical protein